MVFAPPAGPLGGENYLCACVIYLCACVIWSRGQWLLERLGQPFIIENRPDGGGNIATEAVVRAPADGYTLLMVSSANAINATLYDKLNFDFIRDIAPIAGINHSTYGDLRPSGIRS
jgi:Tripartite tricarboxylate transporter family receptor